MFSEGGEIRHVVDLGVSEGGQKSVQRVTDDQQTGRGGERAGQLRGRGTRVVLANQLHGGHAGTAARAT